jgi:hypothetical protein
MKLKYSMGKGIIMDEYFEYLIERTRYYERFEFFREDVPKVKVGLDRSEQLKKEISVVELVLKQSQEKNGSGPKK